MTPRKRQFNRFVFLRLFAYLVIAGGGAALAASFLFDLNRPHIGLALTVSGLLSLLSLRHRTRVRRSGPINEGRSKLLRTLGPAFVVILLTPTAWIITDRNDIVFFVAVALGSTLLVRAI